MGGLIPERKAKGQTYEEICMNSLFEELRPAALHAIWYANHKLHKACGYPVRGLNLVQLNAEIAPQYDV